MANCFHDAINNRWETVAAQLLGKTLAQLQERFLKVMTDVNAIKHGYPENMIITIPVPATPLEHSPLSIPMVNATPPPPPPPPPHWIHHQHHRMEAMAPAAEMAVPMDITLPSSAMSGARREQNQHANSNIIQHEPLPVASSDNNKRRQTVHWTLQQHKLFLQGYEELGKQWSRISSEYVKTRTYAQVVSHSQKFFERQEKRARGEKLKGKSMLDMTDYRLNQTKETLQETKKKKNQEADQETKKKGDLQNAGMMECNPCGSSLNLI
ncbi:hypothetical protein Ahy_B06g085463 [Arachis hypogaea]|uniref:Uncharacterized protein n=1 Tax=Arachis hypogaea TaxID=3818 RepID=A0A444YUQ5_ARAHY|nr:hypothetical protein Ahy_B06g085463 [Arachis hypogaea]